MQLKTSYFNRTLFRKNLARFWPVWGLASLGGAMFPLALLVNMLRAGGRTYFRQGAVEFSAMYYEAVNLALPILSLCYAILIAIAVWSFLYNHRSVSMMHTLPVQRESIYFTNFLSGMAMMLIPYVVTGALTVLVSVLFGYFELRALVLTVAAVLGESFFFFASATFCAFIVSNVFALPVVYFLLHFLAPLLDAVVGDFSTGFLFGLTGGYSGAADFLSPTVYLVKYMGVARTYEEVPVADELTGSFKHYESVLVDVAMENAWLIAVYACVGVLLLGFGWMLYQRHRSESAGDVVAVAGLRPVFRYGAALLGSLVGGIVLYAVLWESFQSGKYYHMLPLLIFMVLSGVVGYFAACMLLEKSFRVFRKSWKGSLLVLVGCALICTALKTDLFRVTQRLPAAEDVEWVEFTAAGNSYLFYPGEETLLLEEVRGLHAAILAEEDYIRETYDAISYSRLPAEEDEQYERENVRFIYRLKNGRELRRSYTLPLHRERIYQSGTADHALDTLINSREMRCKRLHVDDARYRVDSGNIYLEAIQMGYDFNSREAAAVLEALGRDAREGTWGTVVWFDDTRANDYAVTFDLRFGYRMEGQEADYRDWISVRLRPQMTHTVACLQALGYLPQEAMVTYLELYPEEYDPRNEYYIEKYGVTYQEAVRKGLPVDEAATVTVRTEEAVMPEAAVTAG